MVLGREGGRGFSFWLTLSGRLDMVAPVDTGVLSGGMFPKLSSSVGYIVYT